MEELGERIRACVMVELLAADIYEKMAELFPEKRAFFMQLNTEEKNHAALLTAGKGLLRKEDIPDFVAPDSLSEIKEAIDFARGIRLRLDSEDLPLERAIELLIEFENTAAESNFHEVFDDKSEWEIIQKLGGLRVESGNHADRIRLLLQKESSSPE
jgi:rubrerythrin